jgi:hypothetical protein
MNISSLRPSGTATATGFVALVLPYSRHITPSLISKKSAATPFREPLQFIVIAVMSREERWDVLTNDALSELGPREVAEIIARHYRERKRLCDSRVGARPRPAEGSVAILSFTLIFAFPKVS